MMLNGLANNILIKTTKYYSKNIEFKINLIIEKCHRNKRLLHYLQKRILYFILQQLQQNQNNSKLTIMLQKNKLTNIVLLLFNLSLISCYCQGTYFGQYSPCYFYYGFSDINCTVFNFSRCSWSECVAYMRVGNSTVCARTQRFYNSDWGSCTRRCCDSSKSYNYSYNSLQQCEDDQQSKLYLILIIVFSIIGGGIFIFIIILAINKCCYQYQNKNKIECMGQEQQTSSGIVIIKKWKKLQQKQLNNEESCCICLEMGSNCQLQCGHIYHYTCILTWMKINNSCTLCKRTDINKARVYCSRCFEYYCDFLCQQKNKVVHNQICERCL